MNEKNKVDGLNIFRGIAFVCVFLLHAKIFMPMAWHEGIDTPWLIYTPAWAGVWMFFLVSGYGIGAGFYSNKYKASINGIAKFYFARLKGIVPLYWFYILIVTIFVYPDNLLPRGENVHKMLSLLFFNYQEEFDSLQYGLSWYLTTLVRLYIIAPFFYILVSKVIKNQRQSLIMIGVILVVGLGARISMGYHMALTEGDWSSSIYKPFYFNLDIFCTGFLLNKFKCSEKKCSYVGRTACLLLLISLIIVNSYLYYFGNYYGNVEYMNIYCYLFPTLYVIIGSIYIYYFDVRKDYRQTKLNIRQLKKNPLRIFDYFAKIQMPMYLFHSTVLLCLKNGYKDKNYMYYALYFGANIDNLNFVKGCLFTAYAFVITLVWSCIIAWLFSGRKEMKLFDRFAEIDYENVFVNVNKGMLRLLKFFFPLKKG